MPAPVFPMRILRVVHVDVEPRKQFFPRRVALAFPVGARRKKVQELIRRVRVRVVVHEKAFCRIEVAF